MQRATGREGDWLAGDQGGPGPGSGPGPGQDSRISGTSNWSLHLAHRGQTERETERERERERLGKFGLSHTTSLE